MEQIYFLVSQCETWLNNDPNGYLEHYFCSDGGFTHAFLIALAIAIVAAIVFYGWIGMAVNRLANLGVWLATLFADAVLTFIITQMSVIGNSDAMTGIFKSIEEHRSELSTKIPVNDTTGQDNLSNTTTQIIDTLSNGCDVTYGLNISNVIVSIVLFFVISLCVKKLTTHATHIPF